MISRLATIRRFVSVCASEVFIVRLDSPRVEIISERHANNFEVYRPAGPLLPCDTMLRPANFRGRKWFPRRRNNPPQVDRRSQLRNYAVVLFVAATASSRYLNSSATSDYACSPDPQLFWPALAKCESCRVVSQGSESRKAVASKLPPLLSESRAPSHLHNGV